MRKCENAVKAQAEKRMLAGKSAPMEKFPQGTSRDTLGEMAGVSGGSGGGGCDDAAACSGN